MFNITQYDRVALLGVTFQSNCKFSEHAKAKMPVCNKRIKERGPWAETCWSSIQINCAGASKADLFVVDCFLKRRPKKRYISDKLGIYDLFEQSDRKLYDKISKDEHHPLHSILPTAEDCSQRLRRKTFQLPLVKTERFKNCFVHRLCFNYNLAIWYYFHCNF